jgi:phosphomannomutase
LKKDPIKVYDARWEAAEFSDAEVTRLFEATMAYARELRVDTVTFARDARLAAGHVMELGVNEALRQGFRVLLTPDQISTPQSYFTTHHVTLKHPRTMGLTVTASHNPAAYVGVKFVVPAVQAIGYGCGPRNGLTRVQEIYHSSRKFAARKGGALHLLDLGRDYVDFSLKAAGVKEGSLRGLKVVMDSFNGSAGKEIYQGLVRAGATVHAMRLVPDGTFPTGSPNPTSAGKMDPAVAWCKANRYDVVIGIDGDGDRLVFGDRRGILAAGFVTVPILQSAGVTQQYRKARPARVLYDPKVNPLALAEWGKLGVQPVLFRNGHSQIKDYMRRIGAPAAAEESGHYYHRIRMGKLAVTAENSLMTVLFFLAAIKKRPKLLNQLWALQNRIFTTGEFNYQFPDNAVRDEALAAVIRHWVDSGASMVTATPDGIDLEGTCLSDGVDLTPGSVKLKKGWYSGYLRIATNEKGVVRSYFSAGDIETGNPVEQKTREILEKTYGGKRIE